MDATSNRFRDLSPLKQALLALEEMQARLAASDRVRTEPIAVIGMGCRFPGAGDPDRFWKLLCDGEDAVVEVPASRWDVDAYYDPDPDAPGKISTRWGGFLDAVDQFEPEFFGISPREAAAMDPQQRLLLEVVWEALENAGQGPRNLVNGRTGVFVGVTGDEYAQLFHKIGDRAIFNAYFVSGIARSVAGGRISYTLGIQGPNLSIDTACSSSLVALHTACVYLRMGECRMALAGGANVILSPEISIALAKSRMMAADGRCKAFDSRADGFVRGEGCGIVVLKRLSDALSDGDNILALIRGSAINQDGRSSGLTVPNQAAQQSVIRQALANAGVRPEEIGYIEAHGTGTALGDPIEARALAAVLGPARAQDNPLVVGSVKTNIGHLEAAAGVAGFMKAVLALEHEAIPRHLHFHEMNPSIDWGGMPVEIPVEARPWRRGERRRLAGVSAFGFSGTNAHIVLEEAPPRDPRAVEVERPLHILALSARSAQALEQLGGHYVEQLGRATEAPGDICFTANAGRAHFEHRVAVAGSSSAELRTRLEEALPGRRVQEREGIRPVFLFSGQGAQYAGMGKELYATQPVFRRALEECEQLLEQPLTDVLWGEQTQLLEQTAYTQPALFALEYSLAALWRSWGISPSAVLGHSVGEYAAACVAGVYSLAEGLKLIAARARLMQGVRGEGAMAAVMAPEERVREALAGLEDKVAIAALNAPQSVVISGYRKEVDVAEEQLRGAGLRVQRLAVSHAFHSPQMREMEEAFEEVARDITYQAPRVRIISSVTGCAVPRGEMENAAYWRRQVAQPVRFHAGMETLREQGYRVFVEVGPGTTLIGLGQQCVEAEDALWAPSLRKAKGEWEQILESLGRLYVRGAEVDWDGFDKGYKRRRVALPTYPFERQRYWVEGTPSEPDEPGAHPLLGRRFEVAGDSQTCAWESRISTRNVPYLAEHRAFGVTIFPLTAYLEMMIAALGDGAELRDITVYEPLIFTEDEARTVQLIRRGDTLEVFTRDGTTWKRLVTAAITAAEPPAACEPVEALCARMSPGADTESHYAWVRERGMDFGPAFRLVRELWSGTRESLARVAPPDEPAGRYRIHPALLDGCFQALAAALPEGNENLYLPVRLERFNVRRSSHQQLWAHAALRTDTPLTLDFRIFDDAGLVAEAFGLELRCAKPGALLRRPPQARANSLLELKWEARACKDAGNEIAGDWLILADRGRVGMDLARRLTDAGARCTVLRDPAGIGATVRDNAWKGVVHLWALDAPSTASSPCELQPMVCGTALELAQNLAAQDQTHPPRLWLVTRGAQKVAHGTESVAVAQATLWGLAQAIGNEYPEWYCTSVDLDPGATGDETALWDEIRASDGEDQVAFRGAERFVARFAVVPVKETLSEPQRLTVSSRGILDNLTLEPARRRPVPPGCVEIQVDAAGLNFRDVMSVLGMYPGNAGALGSECAGHIVAVGENAGAFKEGDDVIAMVPGGHDGYVIADARLVAPRPVNLTAEQAATLPTVFLTARYTLETLARLRRGDRVLIHAAAGGVGMAAVQVAQRAGAEIFATAGSEKKREFLRSLGIAHVMNSRSLDFAREILEKTGGRGVDVVLNSLAGEFIAASFSVLAREGRFLEIGKRDLWTKEQAERLGRNVAYHIVDLGDVAPETLGELLRDTVRAVEEGELRPLPFETFSFHDAVAAYRFMAQAQHIGKIVLRQSTAGTRMSPHATYLIAGGFGSLGSQLVRWFVARGARNLALAGRGGPNAESREAIEWAEAQGVRIGAFQADIAREEDVARLLSGIAAAMPPLRGIVHAAGVLDDGILSRLTWERFARVLAPKVAGAWNLDRLTAAIPLDFFILFSSIASTMGAPGQGNYAAANAFEDALAHERRSRRLPAISINWGAWGAGMAARDGQQERRQESGIAAMSCEEGLALLDRILLEQPAQVAAGYFDWNRFARRYPKNAVPRRFSALLVSSGAESRPGSRTGLMDELEGAPESSRMGILREHVHALAVRVLGFASGRRIDFEQPLSELGLDSLMAVEFRNRLAATVGRSLPSTLLFNYPTIGDVTACLAGLLFDHAPAAAPQPRDVLDDIEQLSDEEVDRLLAGRLGGVK